MEPELPRSVTIMDVARAAGVSRASVSKVIRDAYGVSPTMKARVEKTIADLDYRPRAAARAMRGLSYTLGFEIPSLHNPLFATMIAGAMARLDDTPYQLVLAPARPEYDLGPVAVRVLADRQVDGLVAISAGIPPEWLDDLGRRVPLVVIGHHRRSDHYDTVAGDDILGAELVVAHLYSQEVRRVVHLTLPDYGPPAAFETPHRMRLDGYRQAMLRRGLRPEVVEVSSNQASACAATRRLLEGVRERVGIFAGHDELALGVLEAVRELRLGPQQVAVVGYDDSAIAAHPNMSLSSVNQSGDEMGRIAVQFLLERIGGRTEPAVRVLSPTLRVRESSGGLCPG